MPQNLQTTINWIMIIIIITIITIASDRKEVTSLIRHEFETTRSVVDPKHVAFLQTSGKRRIERMFLLLIKYFLSSHPFDFFFLFNTF